MTDGSELECLEGQMDDSCKAHHENQDSDTVVPPSKRQKRTPMTSIENVFQKSRHTCRISGCGKSYSRKDNLRQHIKSAHPDYTSTGIACRYKCDIYGCQKAFYQATLLIKHLEADHKVTVAIEKKQFPNWSTFEKWKESHEAATFTCYVRPKGSYVHNDEKKVSMFVCCRDGKSKENKKTRKTGQKRYSQGSKKLDSYCLSRMTASEHSKTGEVVVEYIKTHTNHKPGLMEVKYVPLPEVTRQEVRNKYADGVRLDKIIDDIRGPLCTRENRSNFEEQATGSSFITRQDARNIVRRFENAIKHRYQNDAVSVDRLVSELRKAEDNPVIAYKSQGTLDDTCLYLEKESFLLAIMTKFQAQMFEMFSHKVVCVDSTHKTNPYGFKLVTIVVPDEFKNGIPVAWGIIDREDVPSYRAFFKAVKDRVPTAKVTCIMTDDDQSMPSAFFELYPDAKHLLCRWHVDRAWQRKLYTLVQDSNNREELYKCLHMLLTTTEESTFSDLLGKFIVSWRSKQPSFVEYFKTSYAGRSEKWALCYRHFDHHSVDTNMLVESFHNKLKNNPRYLDHKVNRRLDDLLHVLFKFESDVYIARKTKELMKSPDDASRKQEGARCTTGMAISETNLMETQSGVYDVRSCTDSNKHYTVAIISAICGDKPGCIPQCNSTQCQYLCRHMISCTCWDYSEGHLCKHCHKVWSTYHYWNTWM